jgi:hypothetical protein
MAAFSWSKTRDEVFHRCLRASYYQYYTTYDQVAPSADPFTYELQVMRSLKTRPMWIGNVVHDAARRIVPGAKVRNPPAPVYVFGRLRSDMMRDWKASAAGDYRRDPSDAFCLAEQYYGQPARDVEFESDFRFAQQCVQNVYRSMPYELLANEPSARILEAGNRSSKMDLAGLTVRVVPDLAMKLSDKRIVLVDWKAHRSSGGPTAEFQLSVYALYATKKWSVPPDAIDLEEIDLNDGSSIPYAVSAESLVSTAETIRTSDDEMLSLLADPANNIARESDLPMTDDLARCTDCNFRRACGREVS